MLTAALKADEIAAIVFVDVAIVIVVARLIGALFKKIRQPAVVGEILAGIALGPSLLGLFPGHLTTRVFPLEVRPFLNILAQLGLIIFMFIVGLELDMTLIRGKERIAAVISLSSIALPFSLGFLLAAALHSSHKGAPNADDFLPFALFIGASMSITAFPVLARILTERRMYRTEIGALTLACAAVDDILAWSLLALVLAIVASTGITDLPKILIESILFVAFMFVVVRPQLNRLAARFRQVGRLTPDILAVILVGFLASAFITSEIGIHSIFGAFLFGVIMPREETVEMFHQILERLEQASVLLLLPVFFIVTGFNVDLRGLGRDALTQLPLILLVACAGKFIGATVAARAQGLPGRKATAIGVLMNTRGLTELVILNVGREFGVLDGTLFTMLVVMAVFTTIITEPILRLVYPEKILARDIAEAEKAALGVIDAYRVVVAVDDLDTAATTVDLAGDLVAGEDPAEVVLCRFSCSRGGLEVGSGLVTELAEVASSLEALNTLARRLQERGIPTVVRSRFSGDPSADLAALAAAVEADVVLLSPGSTIDPAAPPWAEVAGHVATPVRMVGGEPDGPIVVLVGDEDDSAAAVELGARLAFSRRAALQLMANQSGRRALRRATAWSESLSQAGVACSSGADDDLADAAARAHPSIVLAGTGAAVPATVAAVTVRAADGDDGRGVGKFVERINGAQAVAASTGNASGSASGDEVSPTL